MVEYPNRTKPLRNTEADVFSFISYRYPHKCISKDTLSRWVTQTMARADLDTNIFSAHCTRHASISKLKRCVISMHWLIKEKSHLDSWFADLFSFMVAKSMQKEMILVDQSLIIIRKIISLKDWPKYYLNILLYKTRPNKCHLQHCISFWQSFVSIHHSLTTPSVWTEYSARSAQNTSSNIIMILHLK